jgi:signal transduction histidine kinase
VLELLGSMFIPDHIQINTTKVIEQPTLLNKLNVNRIIQNLVENAIKYSNKEIPLIEIFVKDNGPGIALQFHDKIFGAFQTLATKDVNESKGIGLAIVKKMVEENGAKITLTSDLNIGSLFSITWKSKELQPEFV